MTTDRCRAQHPAPISAAGPSGMDAGAGTGEARPAVHGAAGRPDGAVSAERCLDLSFASLSQINRQRCQRWHPGFPEDSWTGADWSNAMQGEAGEAGNVVKKLRRAELGTQGALDPPALALRAQLGDEIADTVIYADLLAQFYGLDLALCVARKFNAVSEREGFPERLSVTDATKRGTDGAVPAEPRTIDLSRVRGYMWTDPDGAQRMIPPDEIGVVVADEAPEPAKRRRHIACQLPMPDRRWCVRQIGHEGDCACSIALTDAPELLNATLAAGEALPKPPRVIAWDWKQQIPLDELRAALDAGLVHLHEVDTQSDECAIVLANAPMEPAAVQAAYDRATAEATPDGTDA